MELFVKVRVYPEITLEMIERVFEVDKIKLNLNEAINKKRQKDITTSQSQLQAIHTRLLPIVRILNEIKNGEPAYVKYHLDTEEKLSHFFAQCYHEAGERVKNEKPLVEDLTYGVDGLLKNFKSTILKNFIHFKSAFGYARLDGDEEEKLESYFDRFDEFNHQKLTNIQKNEIYNTIRERKSNEANQENIANLVYAMKNGNGFYKSGDGWRYRGRGMIQLTGKSNYQNFEKWLCAKGLLESGDSLIDNPELLENPSKDYCFLSAVYFWNENSIYFKAKPNEVEQVTRIVNGGTNGLEDREIQYQRIKGDGDLEKSIFKDFRK